MGSTPKRIGGIILHVASDMLKRHYVTGTQAHGAMMTPKLARCLTLMFGLAMAGTVHGGAIPLLLQNPRKIK